MTFCSLRQIDYLREACAPHCGEGDANAPDAGADTAAPPLDASVDADASPSPCSADAGYRALVLCDRPLAYFRLDEQGPPQANDTVDGSAGAYVAAEAGAIAYGAPGAIAADSDKAIHLDGNGYVGGGTALSFPGKAPFSLEAWVAPEGDNFSYRRIFERLVFDGSGQPLDGYIVYNHTTVGAERYVDGGSAQVLGPQLGNLAYSHVLVTFDGSTLRLYVNGALAASTPTDAAAGDVTANLFFGGTDRPAAGWVGGLDEVAAYGYALDASQVTAHYRAGRGE